MTQQPNNNTNNDNKFVPSMYVDASILLLEAKQKLENQKIKEGLDILHHLTLLYPNYSKAYNLLGYVYDSILDDTKTAEKYYKKCLELEPEFKEAYSNYAYCLLVLKRFQELEKFILESLTIPITNKSYLYHLLGKAQEALLKFDEAIESYNNSILHSFDNEDIQAREKDIARCQKKLTFVNKQKNRSKNKTKIKLDNKN